LAVPSPVLIVRSRPMLVSKTLTKMPSALPPVDVPLPVSIVTSRPMLVAVDLDENAGDRIAARGHRHRTTHRDEGQPPTPLLRSGCCCGPPGDFFWGNPRNSRSGC